MLFGFTKAPKGNFDYIIAGLGNPGREYEGTRHNVGFMCIDSLCEKLGVKCNKIKFKGTVTDAVIGESRCLILKPQTFMNLSGQSITEAMKFYKIPPERVIVIFDDISLDVGKIRIRKKGSDGGHNGIKNIIYLSGSDQFPRIKIGVGKKPNPEYDLKKWVLGRFPKENAAEIESAVNRAADAAEAIIVKGAEYAMNKFNG